MTTFALYLFAPADVLTALLVLWQPPGTPLPPLPPAGWRAAAAVAVTNEWLSPGDAAGLTRPDYRGLAADHARANRRDLADCPPAGDARRFPPEGVLRAGLDFADRFAGRVRHLADGGDPRAAALYAAVLAEAGQARRAWQLALDARDARFAAPSRRRWLGELRHLLGDDAYLRAELPPCVPHHRFNELR